VKVSELREMSNGDLEKLISDSKEELFNLRFQKSVGKLTNTSRAREVKKTVARVLTILNERKLLAEAK
jgi:large subunit ribosomal protein L29